MAMLRNRWNLLFGAAALGGLALNVSSAAAQSVQTEKLQVVARIGETCTVTSASLDFGQGIDVSDSNDAEGSIEINCIAETSFDVQLDNGLNPAFSGLRQMSDGSSFLQYQLYKDAARTEVWAAGDQVPATISSSGTVPVYGTVPSQTDGHAPGLYTDEVTITLVF